MTKFKNKLRVGSNRLPFYDYSGPGAYFVTICANNRQCLFGNIVNGTMQLNDAGEIARQCWLGIPNHLPHAQLDEFVIMPNHVHGIIMINDIAEMENMHGANNIIGVNIVGAKNFSPLQCGTSPLPCGTPPIPCGTSKTIGSIVRGYKIGVTKWFRQNTNTFIVWQRNYYEHIIRNDDELNRIRQYIINNPLNWKIDEHYI